MNEVPWTVSAPLPILAIGAVIEAAALLPPFPKVQFSEPSISGSMQYFPGLGLLRIDTLIEHIPYELAVPIIFSSDTRYIKPHFRCFSCGKPRDFLVFDGNLVCTEDYIACGNGKSKRQRRFRVREARGLLTNVERVRQSRWVSRDKWHEGVRRADRYLPALRAAESVDKPVRPKAEAVRPDSAYSTERGLALGRGASQFDAFADYLRDGEELVSALRKQTSLFRRPVAPAPLSQVPVFDIRALARADRWPMPDNAVHGFTMTWPDDVNLLVIIDARAANPFLLVAHRWTEPERQWQLIEVKVQDNGRKRFVCPATGIGCDQLYLRAGVFASREAQNLYHDSQRGTGRARARKK